MAHVLRPECRCTLAERTMATYRHLAVGNTRLAGSMFDLEVDLLRRGTLTRRRETRRCTPMGGCEEFEIRDRNRWSLGVGAGEGDEIPDGLELEAWGDVWGGRMRDGRRRCRFVGLLCNFSLWGG